MSTPSVLLIPDLLKAGKLYSQIPNSGAVDFDVTRATTAFRTNASGILESVASGVPRLDYPIGGGCPSLLVEPAATNLALRSQEINNPAFWALTNATITANNDVAPDGTMTADTLTATANAGQVQGATVGVSGTTYIASFFIKRRTGTGVVNIRSVENVNTPITVTNSWTRVSLAATSTTTTIRIGIMLATLGDAVDLWGAQLETGSVATSYIPTVAATATRNADVISKTGVSGFIGQAEGTIYAEVDYSNNSSIRHLIALSDNTSSNRIRLRITGPTTLQIERTLAGVNAALAVTIPSSGVVKIAIGYSSAANGFVAYVNGSQAGVIAAATATFTNELTKINIGSNSDNAGQLNDRIRTAAIYPTRLTNSQLQSLTTL
jgi:hypothetical protein